MHLLFVVFLVIVLAFSFFGPTSTGEPEDLNAHVFSEALGQLSDSKLRFDVMAKSEATMQELWGDLLTTYKDQAASLKGIEHTSHKYKKVSAEAASFARNTQELSELFVTWLPKMQKMLKMNNAKGLSVILGKLSAEIKPLATKFEAYAREHRTVRDEVEEYATKATELQKTPEWKAKALGRESLPHYGTFLGSVGSGAAAAVAFFAGGPAGYLALTSVASFAGMVALVDSGDADKKLSDDFGAIRKQLNLVHDTLVEQTTRLAALATFLERASTSADSLTKVVADQDLELLIETVVSEAGTRFVAVSKECASYLSTGHLAGALANHTEL